MGPENTTDTGRTDEPAGRTVSSFHQNVLNQVEPSATQTGDPNLELVDSRRVVTPAHEIRAAQKNLNDPYWCNEWLDAVASKRCYDVGASALLENT